MRSSSVSICKGLTAAVWVAKVLEKLIMNTLMLLATIEICNFMGCTWLESAISFVQEWVSKITV
ncbi:MAG: hypothetical protein AAGA83_15410 [Cyanobacteria bacterium P01_F01_bin.116]